MPLLSIVVPTRNREYTALACIKHILSLPNTNFELVVRDCSDDRALEQQLADIQDSRLVYEYGPPVSMTENWNAALELARGDYVCIIGDDDGIMPHTLEMLPSLAKRGMTALSAPYLATYFWPDFPDQKVAGSLVLRFPESFGKLEEVSARGSFVSYLRGRNEISVPRIYHGIVSRDILNDIKRRTGMYFATVVPDSYMSAALVSVMNSYYVIDYPITVSGKSGPSNSGRINRSRRNTDHLQEYNLKEIDLDPLVPSVHSVETQIGNSYVRAFRVMKDDKLIEEFIDAYLPHVYAYSILRNPHRMATIIRKFWTVSLEGHAAGKKFELSRKIIMEISQRIGQRLMRASVARSTKHDVIRISAISSIDQAVKEIEGMLSERGRALELAPV